jgi:hypothetical protein
VLLWQSLRAASLWARAAVRAPDSGLQSTRDFPDDLRCSRSSDRASSSVDKLRCEMTAGHHGIHARSVLGAVQGSSLRSARACARPAGLDGACAQIGLSSCAMAGKSLLGERDGLGWDLPD